MNFIKKLCCKIGYCSRVRAGYNCQTLKQCEEPRNPDWEIEWRKIVWSMLCSALLLGLMFLFSIGVFIMLGYQIYKLF